MKLLLVEADQLRGMATAASLERLGMRVDLVCTGAHARTALQIFEYDLIVIDPALPDVAGERLIGHFRAGHAGRPIIALTGCRDPEFRIGLLELGVDDCLVKPVDVRELCARVRALLRRLSRCDAPPSALRAGPLEMFQATRTVLWHGRPVALTGKEFDVLETLLRRHPRVVSRAQLEDSLYGWNQAIDSNSIQVYVHFLRRKLAPGLIATIRGEGYRIAPDAPAPLSRNAMVSAASG
jgi:two-component system OmpR family response regulator/two-component system response regulator QseB